MWSIYWFRLTVNDLFLLLPRSASTMTSVIETHFLIHNPDKTFLGWIVLRFLRRPCSLLFSEDFRFSDRGWQIAGTDNQKSGFHVHAEMYTNSSRPCTTKPCRASSSASSTWWLSNRLAFGTTTMGTSIRMAARIDPEPSSHIKAGCQ